MIRIKLKSTEIYKFADDNWVVVSEDKNGITRGVQYEKNKVRELFAHDRHGNMF